MTDYKVDNLKPKATRYEISEHNGFSIRVYPTGSKSWIYMYRYNQKQKRLKLGEYPDLSLAEARRAFSDAVLQLKSGIDPSEDKRLEKVSNLEALTMNQLINEYIEKWAKPRKRSWKDDQRVLTGRVAKKWGNAKAKQIKRRDVVLFLDEISKDAPIMANRTLAVLRRMFNFAIERDILEASPCSQVKMPAEENRRERTLSEEEIQKVWFALDKTNMDFSTKLALKMGLITGQRKGEIISLRWDEIDFKRRLWKIPAEKSKNKKPHLVYLSDLALEILKQAKANPVIVDSAWVFPSLSTSDVHITDAAINKAIYRYFFDKKDNKDSPFKGVEKFTPHDLRRTVASHMTAIGIPRLVVSKILNHVESSVTAIYDRHTYEKEKQEAWQLWSNKLEALINTNVPR